MYSKHMPVHRLLGWVKQGAGKAGILTQKQDTQAEQMQLLVFIKKTQWWTGLHDVEAG